MKRLYFKLAPLLILFQGCGPAEIEDQKNARPVSTAELDGFTAGIKQNLIFVEGGEFLMGDFGIEYAPERLPYDRDKHSRPLHNVELSSYLIATYKTTNAEYQFYLKANNLKLRDYGQADRDSWREINSTPNTPAHIDWYEAESYCDWLAKVTGLPFALPTEAQWEYAARSRGQFLMVATDDGTYKAEPRYLITEDYDPKGINISSYGNRLAFAKEQGWKEASAGPLPVDMFAPNPLGLYSMTDNGLEWVQDWYDPDYYQYSPKKDPPGPARPVTKDYYGRDTKVLRGQDQTDPYWGGGANVFRRKMNPLGSNYEDGAPFLASFTMRCVVNSPTPITSGSNQAPALSVPRVEAK